MTEVRHIQIVFAFVLFGIIPLLGQDTIPAVGLDTVPVLSQDTISTVDTTKAVIGSNVVNDSLNSDETKVIEDATLDIAQNRGLFIVSEDGNMQLRILGSVRFLMVYDDHDMEVKKHLHTFDIPTGERNFTQPNYFNGLNLSRIGLEATRQTAGGNVFIRLETDFSGQFGFRIRHAYGQYRNILIGQTWSLFTHITTLISTVSASGPSGTVAVRTPQIRFTSRKLIPNYTLSLGMEYFKPQLDQLNQVNIKSFQIMPDITARIEKRGDWGIVQASGLMTLLSGSIDSGTTQVRAGWGAGVSTKIKSGENGSWYIRFVGGKGITRYINDFNGRGLDVILSPDQQSVYLPLALGANIGYEHHWTSKIYSDIVISGLFLDSKESSSDDFYSYGSNVIFNSFWNVTDGARVGLEYIFARRTDTGGDNGAAHRFSLIFYYDF